MRLERYFDGQFPVLLLHSPSSPTAIVVATGAVVWAMEERLAHLPIKGSYRPSYVKKDVKKANPEDTSKGPPK